MARFYVHTGMELFISRDHTCNSKIELPLFFFIIIGSRYGELLPLDLRSGTFKDQTNLLSFRD